MTDIGSGVTSSGLTASAGGEIDVHRGGTLDASSIDAGGTLYVEKGGLASGLDVSGGYALLSGRVDDIVAGGRALLEISAPAVIDGATFSAANVFNSGYYGSAAITGSWHDVTLLAGAYVVDRNDTIAGLTISAGGELTIDASLSHATISSGGVLIEQRGGATITVARGGEAIAESGTSGGIAVQRRGQLWAFTNAPTGDTVFAGGTLVVSGAGADLAGVSLQSGATVVLVGSATATGVTSGATLISATADIVSSAGAWQNVESAGALIQGATIGAGNIGNLYTGGTFSHATIAAGGELVLSGGTARTVELLSGGLLFESSGSAGNLTVAGGEATQGGGSATNITIDAGGNFNADGGTATHITLLSGGRLGVGGLASNVTISNGGYAQIIVGTVDMLTMVSGGSAYIGDGTVNLGQLGGDAFGAHDLLSGVTIVAGGTLNLSASTLSNVTVRGGGLFLSGTASGLVVSSGGLAELLAGGGSATVLSAGAAVITGGGFAATVGSGGDVELSGGKATASLSGVISAGGTVFVYGTAALQGLTAEAGATVALLGSASQTGLTLDAGATLTTAAIATLSAAGAAELLIDATNTLVGGGLGARTTTDIFAGGLVSKVTLHAGASALLQGGTAENTLVDGGVLLAQAGTADNTTIISGGTFMISTGMARGIVVSAGGMVDIIKTGRHPAPVTPTATIGRGGLLKAASGADLNSVTVSGGGDLYFQGGIGQLFVASGGEAIAQYGTAATGGTVAAGGTLVLEGGTAFNGLMAASGATVIAFGDASTSA